MGDVLDFMKAHLDGILILLLCLIFVAFLAQWFAWIFSIGRFNRGYQLRSSGHSLRFVFSEAAVKLINDFRHLLALVMVLIFAFALGYAMIEARGDLDNMKEALQTVVATLGGLVGSIIGYYFGESSVTKVQDTVGSDTAGRVLPPTAVQGPSETITEAPLPPDAANSAE